MTHAFWTKPVNLLRELQDYHTESWPSYCDVYSRNGIDGNPAYISLLFPPHDTPTPLDWQCQGLQKSQYIGTYRQHPVVSIMLPDDLQIPFSCFNLVGGVKWLGRGNLSAWPSQHNRLAFNMPVRYWTERWNLPLKRASGKMKILFVPLQLNLFSNKIRPMCEALDLEQANYNFLMVILFTEEL